jgi:hypothetical protein
VLAQLGAGDGGADAVTAILLGDRAQAGQLLQVDHQLRLDQPGAQLDEQVGAARQRAGRAAAAQQRDGRIQSLWRFISHRRAYPPRSGLLRSIPRFGRMIAIVRAGR